MKTPKPGHGSNAALGKPSIDALRRFCPDVGEDFLKEHYRRLDLSYFESFSIEAIGLHIRHLSELTPGDPVRIIFENAEGGGEQCTVLAFDYPFEFSCITGILASLGFQIQSGDVFTYRPSDIRDSRMKREGKKGTGEGNTAAYGRRRIIDRFRGFRTTPNPDERWKKEFRLRMDEVFHLLERGTEEDFLQVKQRINEMVSDSLAEYRIDTQSVLYPLHIDISNDDPYYTRLRILSQNTPFFLYSLSNALSVHNISIEHVAIRTIEDRIEDEFGIIDRAGTKITDPATLNHVKLAVLLTKQFTYFLASAPDPYAALSRFESLVGQIISLPEQGKWIDLLSDPKIMQDLARLLGASDFLWEDFIRLQYENLLPMFQPHIAGQSFSSPSHMLPGTLKDALRNAKTLEEKKERLNEFKDSEIYLIDLDHILSPGTDIAILSKRLTALAECIIGAAVDIAFEELQKRFGTPKTVAGMKTMYAVFGLGKTGGAALGYASDIELLFIYSDAGKTDGPEQIENPDFFERLVKMIVFLIRTKREGIFHLDLRLRPYGKDGPLACSLESFCRYFATGGPASALERLALVRLRFLTGEPEFGGLVERIRNDLLYFAKERISIEELRVLREKQFREKTDSSRYNAKFSPGTLVDLEYDVQILQVTYGDRVPELRTPLLHEALTGLATAGVLESAEAEQLKKSYFFFRALINGLRMLRGSALDLQLPDVDSNEYTHLARRIGYGREGELNPSMRLHLEFEANMAIVRTFVERHFGRASLPGPVSGNLADLVLSEHPSELLVDAALGHLGFRNRERACRNLRSLAGSGKQRETFTRLAILAGEVLERTADPDMALNNWERFIRSIRHVESHYELLLAQPMRLVILLSIFSVSQFLSNTLIRNPDFFDRTIKPDELQTLRKKEDIETELYALKRGIRQKRELQNYIRRIKKREILRIAIRDICLQKPLSEIVNELSILAEAEIEYALRNAWLDLHRTAPDGSGPPDIPFCVMAFGKLGGEELNYSSDIDIMGIYDETVIDDTPGAVGEKAETLFRKLMEQCCIYLTEHTEEGYVYRVDLRLRPYGSSGSLVRSIPSLLKYYQNNASLWEIQALLKIRPVAGNMAVGESFLRAISSLFTKKFDTHEVVHSIEALRNRKMEISGKRIIGGLDIKNDAGGIRDIEFLTQGLQLINCHSHEGLCERNTIRALERLNENGIVSAYFCDTLTEDYHFLRRIEHFLQMYEDQQTHSLPQDIEELKALTRRIMGIEVKPEEFIESVEVCMQRVRDIYAKAFLGLA
ncbi:MAG: glutamate-ammonia-ligase adenylyltransferase [Spirochaetales bacterium]|nr:glutamate-ammonia-ligase adenylyltransferase [Spirochaetales bacterium]